VAEFITHPAFFKYTQEDIVRSGYMVNFTNHQKSGIVPVFPSRMYTYTASIIDFVLFHTNNEQKYYITLSQLAWIGVVKEKVETQVSSQQGIQPWDQQGTQSWDQPSWDQQEAQSWDQSGAQSWDQQGAQSWDQSGTQSWDQSGTQSG